ncbi:MAG: hypothetical protein ACRDB0_03335, partial [Paraclostridium sp.]
MQRFNPNPFASVNPNYKVMATAQLTITDQTDASNLAGNMTVVTGGKSQVYLTGATQPYSPDWKANNLVIRPYMIATNIYRGQSDAKYNPDLFDPWEYPDLTNPGDTGISGAYIRDIKWYTVDSAGNETLIDTETDNKYSHEYTYSKDEQSKLIKDSRQLVVKDNVLSKDSTLTFLIKFAFHDPFANINIPMVYSIDVNCISTGVGNSKTNIISVNGTTFYNADPDKLLFVAEYFSEGEKQDLEGLLSDALSQTNVKWFIRTQSKDGWAILDPVTQDDNIWNVPGEEKAYEIHRVTEYDPNTGKYTTVKTNSPKGGTALYVYKGLIAGSDIIKLTVQDSKLDGQTFSALETLLDYSDPTQCYIHSSNGDKLYKGMQGIGTTAKAVITHNGILLGDNATEYNTLFDYYWYKIESDGNKVYNVYVEDGKLKEKYTGDSDYIADNGWPRKSTRSIEILPDHIDTKATFTVDILNKQEEARFYSRENLFKTLVTEEEFLEATVANEKIGIHKLD